MYVNDLDQRIMPGTKHVPRWVVLHAARFACAVGRQPTAPLADAPLRRRRSPSCDAACALHAILR